VSDAQRPKRRRIAGETRPGTSSQARRPATSAPRPTRAVVPPAAAAPRDGDAGIAEPSGPTRAERRAEKQARRQEARDARPPRRRMSRAARRVVVPLAVLAVAALGLGVWAAVDGYDRWQGDDDVATAHRQAAAAAGTAMETVFSYRFDELEQHEKDATAVMTDAFAKQFDSIAPALDELAPQRQVQVRTVTRSAAPRECGDECADDEASVLVFFDQARVTADTQEPTVFGNRVVVSMQRQDGRWLVDDIRAL
jgi:hypothetical protein